MVFTLWRCLAEVNAYLVRKMPCYQSVDALKLAVEHDVELLRISLLSKEWAVMYTSAG
jgi:hypothetical protein